MRKIIVCLTTLCLLVLCTGCNAGKAAPEQDPATPRKVIVDCDMGYMNDDAVALLFLLQADKLGYIDLAGICVSGGNQPGAVAANATLLLLEETQRTDIPVYIGTDEPLMGFNAERANRDYAGEVYASLAKGTYVTPDHYHDLGDLYRENWGYSTTMAREISSSEFLVEMVDAYPGEITVLCIGPATNIALACLADDSFAAKTAGIFFMGGKIRSGSDFNWRYDADAVRVCLESAFPQILVCTSEISGSMAIPSAWIEDLASNASDPDDPIVATLVNHQSTICSNKKLWDLVVPAVLLRPDLIVDSQVTEISVDTDENSYGVMHVGEGSASATIVSRVSGEQIYAWFQSLFRDDAETMLTQLIQKGEDSL